MPYIQKHVLEKEGSDPILEYFLGPTGELNAMLAEPGGATVRFYRTFLRSYVETHNAWDSKEAYEAWLLKHGDAYITQLQNVENWMAEVGITYKRYDHSEKDWNHPAYHFSFLGSRITAADEITFDQIFE